MTKLTRKSAIMAKAAKEAGITPIVSQLAKVGPTDWKGLPWATTDSIKGGATMTFTTTFKRGDRVSLRSDRMRRGNFLRREGLNEAIVEWDGDGNGAITIDSLIHAPVTVIGAVPPQPPHVCPNDGNALDSAGDAIRYDRDARGKLRKRTVHVVFCGFCDFLEEVHR